MRSLKLLIYTGDIIIEYLKMLKVKIVTKSFEWCQMSEEQLKTMIAADCGKYEVIHRYEEKVIIEQRND